MAERRRGCGWPPAPPRRHFGSRCCARSGIAPRQPFLATSRVREAPRLAALPRRPSYAVAAEGRRCLRSAVRGRRRVLALDFQVGFPAGAVVPFIHWRWQPTGAGDLAIIANKVTAKTNRLCSTLSRRVQFQRTSTRQQLDCAKTRLCSQGNRRTRTSGGPSTCSGSNPRSHSRGQEFCRNPSRPSQLAD
jgi:hypothetical protein